MVKLVVIRKDNNEDVKRWEERETGRKLDGKQGRQMTDAIAQRVKSKNQGLEMSTTMINLNTDYMLRQCFEQQQSIHTAARVVLLLSNQGRGYAMADADLDHQEDRESEEDSN
jgi:hypothetical protein